MRSSVCGNAYHPLVIYALDPIDNTFNSIQRQLRDVSPNGFGSKNWILSTLAWTLTANANDCQSEANFCERSYFVTGFLLDPEPEKNDLPPLPKDALVFAT